MDSQSLNTASAYINNLLLSRGLLRNGTPIEFATPAKTEGGVDATMAQIMNLVHDLILRRDRESESLSTLSQNLQTLRSSSAQQTQVITRLETRNSETDRHLALASTQELSAKKALKTAETKAKTLKEEMLKLKGTVQQIRCQCANDVRRRDGEISRLKRHLEGRRSRDGSIGQVGVVVVTPGMNKAQSYNRTVGSEVDVASSQYSLRQESTDFLTQLSQGLSNENDALIGLVRSTLNTLRDLQGLAPDPILNANSSADISSNDFTNAIMTAPPSYEVLAASAKEVLTQLQTLLTNPSFVPIEELEVREDEIIRLRGGWEKMEIRWKEAVVLMDGWRKRMLDTGDTINLEDIKMGMKLGTGLPEAPIAHQDLHKSEGQRKDPGNDTVNAGEVQKSFVEHPISELTGSSNTQENETKLMEPKILQSTNGNARASLLPGNGSFPDNPRRLSAVDSDLDDEMMLSLSSVKELGTPDRLMSPLRTQENSPVSFPRTIQSKLEKAQAEANEAKRREERRRRRKSNVVKKLKGNRRRSTLSPEELEKLLGLT
ncbi:MAG: hypothetical protein Q9214_000029 [Letrouitia sp. 1 TL-2023]